MRERRKDFSDDEVEEMRRLETEGKTRKEIALIFGTSAPNVTRKLGARRKYGQRRAA